VEAYLLREDWLKQEKENVDMKWAGVHKVDAIPLRAIGASMTYESS
jgi:hypothetical protein